MKNLKSDLENSKIPYETFVDVTGDFTAQNGNQVEVLMKMKKLANISHLIHKNI